MADFIQTVLQSAAAADGNGTSMDIRNAKSVCIQLVNTGSPSGTVNFEGSLDGGTTWNAVAMRASTQTAAATLVTTTTAAGLFVLPPDYALSDIRARISSYASGAFTVYGTRKSI